MSSEIKVSFSGNLGKDASFKLVKTKNGESPNCQFSVATSKGYGDKKETEWVNVTVWGKHSEKLSTFLTKGTKVTIYGFLTKRMYEKDGKTYCNLDVDASERGGVVLHGSKEDGRRNEDKRDEAGSDDEPF